MHFPRRGKKRGYIGIGKKIRRAVRAVEHADFPSMSQWCLQCRPEGNVLGVHCRRRHMQHIARTQRASTVPAELAEGEGGF